MRSKSTIVALFFITATLVAAWVLDRALTSAMALARINNASLLGDRFTTSTLAALVIAAAIAFIFWSRPKSKAFVGEVVDELYKVNWPAWEETKVSTVVVIVTSVIAAAILGVFDITFGYLASHNLFLY